MKRSAVLLTCIVMIAASCGGGETSQERPQSTATIQIAQPEANEIITAKSFTVRLVSTEDAS
jgi:hypothetical protein